VRKKKDPGTKRSTERKCAAGMNPRQANSSKSRNFNGKAKNVARKNRRSFNNKIKEEEAIEISIQKWGKEQGGSMSKVRPESFEERAVQGL